MNTCGCAQGIRLSILAGDTIPICRIGVFKLGFPPRLLLHLSADLMAWTLASEIVDCPGTLPTSFRFKDKQLTHATILDSCMKLLSVLDSPLHETSGTNLATTTVERHVMN